jgi:ATP-dependent DNA helicase RecG
MKETQRTEFKRLWKDEYLKWISGFANAEGGVLVIGRDDSGKTVGVANAGKLLEDIPNKVRDVLGIIVDVALVVTDEGELVEIRVEPYPYPVSYKGEYHYRSGSTKQELKGAALDRFLLRKQGLHWDGVPLPGLGMSELDKTVLQNFRKMAIKSQRLPNEILDDTEALLIERLRLVNGDYLKRATALLFHPDPERFVTGAFIKTGYFERNHADLRYQDDNSW